MTKKIDVAALSPDDKVKYGLRLSDSAQVATILSAFVFIATTMVFLMVGNGTSYFVDNQRQIAGMTALIGLPSVLFAVSRYRKVLDFKRGHPIAYRDGQEKLANLDRSNRWIWKTDVHGDPIQKKPKK